jgi:hypothetical protein
MKYASSSKMQESDFNLSETFISAGSFFLFLLFKTYGVESVQMADRSGTPPVNANISRQRGNPNNKDWYGYANLTICIKLNKAEDICQAYK